jgi:thymidylate synthase (FAD)
MSGESLPDRIELTADERRARPVLDYGYVRYVDHMGSDRRIVDSARRSYQEGTRPISDDRVLLRYLYRHEHMSPFEQCELAFDVKMPIFVARQMMRHRTASLNELSGRYSILPEEVYIPAADRIQAQSVDSKQGSGEMLDAVTGERVSELLTAGSAQDFVDYHELLDLGVARELARIKVPVSTYTNFDWKQNLRNLLHMVRLRLDDHAQQEVRVYAEVIADFIERLFPLTWEAFVDYELEATQLTRLDLVLMREMFSGQSFAQNKFEHWCDQLGLSNRRERAELITKLTRIGVEIV